MPSLHVPLLLRAGVVLAVLLASSAQVPVPTPTPTPLPPPTAIVAGRIVDAAGAPVPNAVASLVSSSGPQNPRGGQQGDRVVTNADGRFAFVGLAAGGYRIESSKPGWLAGGYGRKRPGGGVMPIILKDGERRNDLTLTMWRVGVLGGRVTADNGDPLIGAEVRAMRRTYIAGRSRYDTPVRERTDDRGVFRFSTLLPGDYLVVVLMSVLSEPPTFAGAIRASGQQPRAYLQTMAGIASAPVLFDRATGVMGPDQPLVSSLSQSLSAPVEGQPLLAYATTFHPGATSQASATSIRVVSGQPVENADVVVRLAPTWQVSGVLRDADAPLPWHAVHLVPLESGDMPLVDTATAVTDGNGAFTFYGVPRGQYIARGVKVPWPAGYELGIIGGTGAIQQIGMFGRGPGAAPPAASPEPLFHVSEPVSVSDRHVRGLTLTMQPGPRVKGLVRFEGTAEEPPDLSRVNVRLEAANGRPDNAFVTLPGTLSNDRRFATAGSLPGRYYLRVAPPPPGWTVKSISLEGREILDAPFDLNADIDNVLITFTDKPRTITGTIASTGAADAQAFVVLFPVDSSAWVDYGRTSLRVQPGSTANNTAFTLSLPPDGDYYIAAIGDEDTDDWQNPATLKRIAAVAERIKVAGESISGQVLQLRRFR